MDDVDVDSVETQVAPEQQDQDVPQQTEVAQQAGSRQDYNWKAARERQKELERELRMQKEFNEKLMQAQMANQQVQKHEPDELDSIADDDFVPKGKSKKLIQKETQHIRKETDDLKKELGSLKQQLMYNSLHSRYSDFNEIVNQETLAQFEQQEPELAQTISESNDPYKVLMQSYKYIKALGIAGSPEAKRSKEVDKKLEKNSKTVQSPQAFEKRPMAQAFKMAESKEEQRKLYEEMMGHASKVGYSY